MHVATTSNTKVDIRMKLLIRIDHTAFSWHSQSKSKWPIESEFDELQGAPNAFLALHTPRLLPPLKIIVPTSIVNDVIPIRLLCERADERGAWVNDYEAGTLGPSADGRWWRAHSCVYSSVVHTPKCIGSRFSGARIFGDSHMRRAWKDLKGLSPPFASEGANESLWCTGRHNSRVCVCEDGHEGGVFEEGTSGSNSFGGGNYPLVSWNWGGSGFDAPDRRAETSSVLASGAVEARPGIVIFDLIHWDAAFSTFFRFSKELEGFIEELRVFFNFPITPFDMTDPLAVGVRGWAAARGTARSTITNLHLPVLVYRTPSFYAGQDTGNLRKFSTARLKLFHEHALKRLTDVFGGHLLVWDVFSMGRARPMAVTEAITASCWSGHEPSQDVGIQNQVLLNALCN
jgi:hypothetical protein